MPSPSFLWTTRSSNINLLIHEITNHVNISIWFLHSPIIQLLYRQNKQQNRHGRNSASHILESGIRSSSNQSDCPNNDQKNHCEHDCILSNVLPRIILPKCLQH